MPVKTNGATRPVPRRRRRPAASMWKSPTPAVLLARAWGTSRSSASISSSRQCEASRRSESAGPSIQKLSLLTTRKGSSAIIGAAWTSPPPVSSSSVRSSLIVTSSPSRVRREMRFERVGEIMDVDHDLLDPRGAQPVEDMVDQRLAGDFDQRLGAGRGQRAHALAEPRRHDHRGARRGGLDRGAERHGAGLAVHAASQAAARAEAGTLASNHALTGASAGCARSRSSRPHMRGWNLR